MVQLLNAHIVAQALYVAAQLGLADLLRDGAKSIDALADAAGAHAASLHRLLRMLAGEGVFREVRDGEFALTALGETLQSDSPNSVRHRALYLAAPEVFGHTPRYGAFSSTCLMSSRMRSCLQSLRWRDAAK